MNTRNRQNWFGSLFRRISLNLTNLFDHNMLSIGITSSHYWILKLLWEGDGLTQKHLVNELGVRPASLTQMIDNMVSKGWIKRSPDPNDARINRIYLTEAGEKLQLSASEVITECEETLCNGFTEEELELFRPLLKKVLVNLEEGKMNKIS